MTVVGVTASDTNCGFSQMCFWVQEGGGEFVSDRDVVGVGGV